MVALKSLREALRTLSDVPVLLVGGLIYALVVAPQNAFSLAGVAVVPTALGAVTFFITPFVIAGLIGMAGEALVDGTTDLSTLVEVGWDRYRSLLIGTILEFSLTLMTVVIAVVSALLVVIIPGASLLGVTGSRRVLTAEAGIGGIVLFGAAALLVALILATLFFFIQFYAVAIVHNRTNTLDGFRQSFWLVRDNLRPALGFSLVNLLVSLLTSLPIVVISAARFQRSLGDTGGGGATPEPSAAATFQLFSLPEVIALTVVSLLLTTALIAFRQVYATAFYRALSPRPQVQDY